MTLIDPDHPKAAPLMESETRDVLREDARDDFPEAALGIGSAECLEGCAPGSGAARLPSHVDGMLGNAGIRGAPALGAGACPRHDLSVPLGHYGGKPVALVNELRRDLR